jgi:hypothetical protein
MRTTRLVVELDGRGLPPIRADFERPLPFWAFLLVSVGVFTAGTLLGIHASWEEPSRVVELDLTPPQIDGVQDAPLPLGDLDAGKIEETNETEDETQEMVDPHVIPVPPVPVQSDFREVDPMPPVPVDPKPIKAKPLVKRVASSPSKQGENLDPNAMPGPRGVRDGRDDGGGATKGTFISRPNPPYDNMMITRNYEGIGQASIRVSKGQMVSIALIRKTGVPYLDSRAVEWIRSAWRPSPEAEGTFTFAVVFRRR